MSREAIESRSQRKRRIGAIETFLPTEENQVEEEEREKVVIFVSSPTCNHQEVIVSSPTCNHQQVIVSVY